MAKQTITQRKAVLKYRREKTHSLVMNFPKRDYNMIDAYCKFKQTPVATWVRKLIWGAINTDETFVYVPAKEENEDTT